MVTYEHMMLRTKSMTNCNKGRSLVDLIYWSQTYNDALSLANEYALRQHALTHSRTRHTSVASQSERSLTLSTRVCTQELAVSS
jgi:hypothetical protein